MELENDDTGPAGKPNYFDYTLVSLFHNPFDTGISQFQTNYRDEVARADPGLSPDIQFSGQYLAGASALPDRPVPG